MSAPQTARPVTPTHLAAFGGHTRYRQNHDAAGRAGLDACCVLCGRYVGASDLFVFLTNVGEYTTREEAAAHEAVVVARGGSPDDLGYYPVGSACARRLRAACVTVYDKASVEANVAAVAS